MERFGATDLEPKKRSTWQQPKTSHDSIKKLLTVLAIARQATIQEAGLLTYCRGLDGFLLEDLQAAVGTLSLQDRVAGQSSMPTLGTMVTTTQQAAQKRFEKARQDKERQESEYREANPDRFVSWKEIMEDMGMMQDACAVAFGKDFRSRYRSHKDSAGRMVYTVQLGDVYAQAMEQDEHREAA